MSNFDPSKVSIQKLDLDSEEAQQILKILGLSPEGVQNHQQGPNPVKHEVLNRLPDPDLVDKITMMFGLVRSSRMLAALDIIKNIVEMYSDLNDRAMNLQRLNDEAADFIRFLEAIGIDSIKVSELGKDEDGNNHTHYGLDIDIPKATQIWRQFGFRFELLNKPEGTKDFDAPPKASNLTPHEQYEKDTGIDTLGMPGRNPGKDKRDK